MLMLPKGLVRYWHIFLPLLMLGVSLTPLILRFYVETTTQSRRYVNINQVPPKPVAIVFGAGVWEDGTPMPMLADRIEGAIDLYHRGQVQKILMTGDNATPEYNEVIAMQSYAEDRGIPVEDIRLDYAGFSTYESCYRAREIFGVQRAVLITQHYHLPRAVYTCYQLGIDAVGYGTPDWGRYQDEPMRLYTQREILAIVKALLELHILRPKPTFLGPFEGM